MRTLSSMAAVLLFAGAASAEDKKPLTDTDFVAKAASGGMFEVESSKMAKDVAASADVKKFAEKMIADHGKANGQLMAAAKAANVPVPEKMLDPDRALLDGLKAAKEESFDKAYLAAQVKAHDEAVMLFTTAAASVKDPALKAFAEKTLPTLKEHQQHVRKLAGGE